MIATGILSVFIFLLFIIFLYSLSQLGLIISYFKKDKKEKAQKWYFSDPSQMPLVTVQLPIYNEKPVVERLLRNIAQLNYPSEKLQIQVLDDSTDDSVELTSQLISESKDSGLDIVHLRRNNREGFKAGALKEGVKTVKGEFIAVFDSDFLPKPDWLLQTLPYFKDENIGVVQTRWGHLNRDYSLLTKLQAFLLDFHFVLEQNGRNRGGHFINFNGTAGIWRKKCIFEAGNWQADTLTEDLDLSYRAQLQGWKFKYLENVETPAELPITIEAARSQQFRWNKGAAENFQKNYKKMLFDPQLSLPTKLQGFFHLLNSSLFFVVFVLALLSLALLFPPFQVQQNLIAILSFFSISTLIFFVSYWISFSRIYGSSFKNFIRYIFTFFGFFSIAMGLSVHNSIAVLEGHFGKKSEFIRTPKFNVSGSQRTQQISKVRLSLQLFLEIVMMLCFGAAVIYAFSSEIYILLLFHFMLFIGFSYVVLSSFHIRFLRPFRFPKPVRSGDR